MQKKMKYENSTIIIMINNVHKSSSSGDRYNTKNCYEIIKIIRSGTMLHRRSAIRKTHYGFTIGTTKIRQQCCSLLLTNSLARGDLHT